MDFPICFYFSHDDDHSRAVWEHFDRGLDVYLVVGHPDLPVLAFSDESVPWLGVGSVLGIPADDGGSVCMCMPVTEFNERSPDNGKKNYSTRHFCPGCVSWRRHDSLGHTFAGASRVET